MTLALCITGSIALLFLLARQGAHARLEQRRNSVADVWQMMLDNPMLGPQTFAEVEVFCQIMGQMIEERDGQSLFPGVRARAERIAVTLSTAPSFSARAESISARDVQRLGTTRERLLAA